MRSSIDSNPSVGEMSRKKLEIMISAEFDPINLTKLYRTHSGAVMQQRSIPHLISDGRATTDTTIVDN